MEEHTYTETEAYGQTQHAAIAALHSVSVS